MRLRTVILVCYTLLPAIAVAQTTQTQDSQTTTPGTSNSSILPGVGSIPSLKEKRPTSRDPRYQAPILPPGFKINNDQIDNLLLFSGDIDPAKWLESKQAKKNSGKSNRYEEGLWDDLPPGGEERLLREQYLKQFNTGDFPYKKMGHQDEPETPANRFRVVFFISLPFTAAASYGLFKLAQSAAKTNGAFNRGETIGMVGLSLGLSTSIGVYDYYQTRPKTSGDIGYLRNQQMISGGFQFKF